MILPKPFEVHVALGPSVGACVGHRGRSVGLPARAGVDLADAAKLGVFLKPAKDSVKPPLKATALKSGGCKPVVS